MPIGGFAGDSFGDLIERTYRRLMSNQRELVAQLALPYTGGQSFLTLVGPQCTLIQPGSLLCVEQEVFLVDGWTPAAGAATGGTATVVGGYQGSANANHATLDANGFAQRVYIDPRYSRWDIGVALNDALDSLSSVSNGLFQTGVTTITWNPVYMGYDLGTVPNNATWLLELTFDIPWPSHNFPAMGRHKMLRLVSNAKFPSGRGIIFYRGGYPGFNVNIGYGYPFTHMFNITDEVVATSGLPTTALDLPSLMAEVFLTESREIKRNWIEAQPDPRKAEDVPAAAMNNALSLLRERIDRRISEERENLTRLYPARRPLT